MYLFTELDSFACLRFPFVTFISGASVVSHMITGNQVTDMLHKPCGHGMFSRQRAPTRSSKPRLTTLHFRDGEDGLELVLARTQSTKL